MSLIVSDSLEKEKEDQIASFFLGTKVHIDWHENQSSFVSCKKEKKMFHLRLHRFFLQSDEKVFKALADYLLKQDAKAKFLIRKEAHLYFSQGKGVFLPLEKKGAFYDLGTIYEDLKERFFSETFSVSIGWKNKRVKERARSITLGTYDRHRNAIEIHSILDDEKVPSYFIEYVVYHEMLHAIIPSEIDEKGRIVHHTKQFRRQEKLFPYFLESKEWEKDFFSKMRKTKKGSKEEKRYGRS